MLPAGEPVRLDSWGLGSVGKEHAGGVPKNMSNVVCQLIPSTMVAHPLLVECKMVQPL